MALKLVLALTLLVCGCASSGFDTRPDNRVQVRVENFNWNDAVVYAVVNGSKMRLGRVRPLGTRTFRVSKAYTASHSIQLYVRFTGSGNVFYTPRLPIEAGQQVEFIIRQYLPFSTFTPRGMPQRLRRITRLPPLRQATQFTGTDGGRNDV